jgi:hypothetical protein
MQDYIPLDGEPSNSGLLVQDVTDDPLEDGLAGGLVVHLGGVVLVVHVVADTDKLTAVVGTGEEEDGDAHDLGDGKLGHIRGVGLEEELVDTDGDGTNEQVTELLVIIRAAAIFTLE